MNTSRASWIRLAIVLLLFAMPSRLVARDGDDQNNAARLRKIAARFVPPKLAAESDPISTPLAIIAVRLAQSSDGSQLIVAGYSTFYHTALRVLKATGDSVALASELAGPDGAHGIRIDLLDVDGDGKPELIVDFGGDRGDSIWVVKVTGTSLTNIPPMQNGRSMLSGSIFVDLDSNSKLVAINGTTRWLYGNGEEDREQRSEIFRLVSGRYQWSGEIVYFRDGFGADPVKEAFHIDRPDVPYHVLVVNGDNTHHHSAQQIDVVVNGAKLVGDEDESEDERRVISSGPVKLLPDNELQVNVQGDKRTRFFVAIAPLQPIPYIPLTPIVDCVWDEGGGRFTASFGWRNENGRESIVEYGTHNSFSGDRQNRGQPTTFLPGEEHRRFWVQSNGEPLTWNLDSNAATATIATAPPCEGKPPMPRNSQP